MRAALLVVACACTARTTPHNAKPPEAGISLSLYADADKRYGVVDDRRWVEVSGTKILLGNIDPGASLASLVIEPTNPALRIGPCTRDRLPDLPHDPLKEHGERMERRAYEDARRAIRRTLPNVDEVTERPDEDEAKPAGVRFAPIVECAVAGPPGRHLVRIVYVSSTLAFRAQHDLEMTEPSRARIASRFAIATPPWRERADVVLYDGRPGGERAPRALVHGQITLDGGTSVLVVPEREVAAHVRRIYEGAINHDGELDAGVDSMTWGEEAVNAVWATLELPGVRLAPGPVRVHVDIPGEDPRWIDVPAARRKQLDDAAPLRIPLWVDDTLRGTGQRQIVENDGRRMVEAYSLAITNVGDTPREVWIEERLRPAKRRRVERAWPKKPIAIGDVVRNVIQARPGRVERVGYLVFTER